MTRSVQEAELEMDPGLLEEPRIHETLERFGRGYWQFLNRVSLRVLRIAEGDAHLSIVPVRPRVELLRFGAPRYDAAPAFGSVSWPIESGLLVAPGGRGRGHLRFDLRRIGAEPGGGARVQARAVVSDYHPRLGGSGRLARVGAFFYSQTQLRVHVLVTRGYLRSLERGELPPAR
jgi:hypothetical protein